MAVVSETKTKINMYQTRNELLKTSYWNYSEQLEEFIARYKTRPPDIKFWPYGPYWPKYHEREILETPRFIKTVPNFHEKFLNQNTEGKSEVKGHGCLPCLMFLMNQVYSYSDTSLN